MTCRGIRGAVCADANHADAIFRATRRLLECVVAANDLLVADLASVIFTATSDLDAAYPAHAAREMGWADTPLLCMQEMAVAGSPPRCIRVLVHWNTDRAPQEVRHVYLGAARALRPDLVEPAAPGAPSDRWPDGPSKKETL
jgi:chorismate mutase